MYEHETLTPSLIVGTTVRVSLQFPPTSVVLLAWAGVVQAPDTYSFAGTTLDLEDPELRVRSTDPITVIYQHS